VGGRGCHVGWPPAGLLRWGAVLSCVCARVCFMPPLLLRIHKVQKGSSAATPPFTLQRVISADRLDGAHAHPLQREGRRGGDGPAAAMRERPQECRRHALPLSATVQESSRGLSQPPSTTSSLPHARTPPTGHSVTWPSSLHSRATTFSSSGGR